MLTESILRACRRRAWQPASLPLLAAVLAPALAIGQPAPALVVDGNRIRPGIDSLAVHVIRGDDTVRTGMMVDEIAVREQGGEALLVRVYRSGDRVLGLRLDTIVDRLPTLAPVRHRSRTERRQEFLDFTAAGVTGWLRLASGDSSAVSRELSGQFFNGSSVDLVLRAAPLDSVWQAAIPAFLPTTRTVVPLQARVTGREVVEGEQAWRVVVDFAGVPVTFWIGERTRSLLRQSMRIAPDAEILFARPRLPEVRKRALGAGGEG